MPRLALLSPLAESLYFLNIRYNPDVDDDAACMLAAFTELQFLFAVGTTMTMYGLSKIAETLYEDRRRMGICLPDYCDRYLVST